MQLVKVWNRSFGSRLAQRSLARHAIRQNLTITRSGKGNKAWRRAEALDRRADVVVWPTYCR